jgi:hypothetical protein
VKPNRYVRNGSVQISDDGCFRMIFLYGEAVYDPRSDMFGVGGLKIGRPNELVFHITGRTFYPTLHGYLSFSNGGAKDSAAN